LDGGGRGVQLFVPLFDGLDGVVNDGQSQVVYGPEGDVVEIVDHRRGALDEGLEQTLKFDLLVVVALLNRVLRVVEDALQRGGPVALQDERIEVNVRHHLSPWLRASAISRTMESRPRTVTRFCFFSSTSRK